MLSEVVRRVGGRSDSATAQASRTANALAALERATGEREAAVTERVGNLESWVALVAKEIAGSFSDLLAVVNAAEAEAAEAAKA